MSRRITREQFLEVWRQAMDPSYTDPLENEADGRGLDVISALARLFERVSEAVEVSTQALYLKPHTTQLQPPASGGVRATTRIEIRRDLSVNAGAIPLEVGDQVTARRISADGDEVLGPVFALTEAVAVSGPGPFTAAVRAVREGFQGNVTAGTAAVFVRQGSASVDLDAIDPVLETLSIVLGTGNRFVDSMVGQFLRVTTGVNAVQQPARITGVISETQVECIGQLGGWVAQMGGTAEVLDAADLGVSAVFLEQLDGDARGRSAELDAIARERNQGRASGEADESLQRRVCVLADTVSPNALIRGISNVLTPLGVDFVFIEVASPEITGFVFDEVAFDDPRAYRDGEYFLTSGGVALVTIGFIVVVDGTQIPAPVEANVGALTRAIVDIKLGGVPFAIAFEPPIPGGP